MGLKVAEATVGILELALDEHVGTIAVVRCPEMHLKVVTVFRHGHVIKLDLHSHSSRQANAWPFSSKPAAETVF
jgi:hypothetical protein